MAVAALPYFQIAVAGVALIGAVHSLYRGTLGEMKDYISRIPHIEQKVEDIEDENEKISDAVVLLGHASTRDDVEPDPQALERDLRDNDKGPGRYARESFYRGGRAEAEDEEEEVRCRDRKPVVDEPE